MRVRNRDTARRKSVIVVAMRDRDTARRKSVTVVAMNSRERVLVVTPYTTSTSVIHYVILSIFIYNNMKNSIHLQY